MSDIERRLRELGERARFEQSPGNLPAAVTGRIKRRRLATVVTSVLVTAALAFGGVVAVGAFEPPAEIGPAEGRGNVLIDYHRTGGFAGEDTRLIMRSDATASVTVVENGESITTEHEVTDDYVRAVEASLAAIDWPAAAAERRRGPVMVADGIEFELRHEGYVVSGYHREKSRDRVDDLVALLDALLRNLKFERERESKPVCPDRIDFEPTHLPEGWSAELQEGGGDGEDAYGNIAGHYGVEPSASDHEKVDAGFINVVPFNFPFEAPSDGDLTVLGLPAEFDEENGTVEFGSEGCAYALVGAGVGREHLVPFAEGLRPKRNSRNRPSEDESLSAFWPDDTQGAAEQACEVAAKEDASHDGEGHDLVSYRSDPESVVLEFGYEVLGWAEPLVFDRSGSGDFKDMRTVYELKRGNEQGASPREAAVIVDAIEVLADCWSVSHVSRMPDREPTGFSVSVRGREVRVGVADLGATSLSIEVGYAGRKVQENGPVGEKGLGVFTLDFDPDTPGYALVLFRDANGEVFSAASAHFPAGDFAAG